MQPKIALMVCIIFMITKECIAPHGLLNTAHFAGGSSPVSLSSGSACAIAGVLVASTAAMAVNLLKRGNAARTLMTEAVKSPRGQSYGSSPLPMVHDKGGLQCGLCEDDDDEDDEDDDEDEEDSDEEEVSSEDESECGSDEESGSDGAEDQDEPVPDRLASSRSRKLWSALQFPEGMTGANNYDLTNLVAAQKWKCPCTDRVSCIGLERLKTMELYEYRKAFRTTAANHGGLRDASRTDMAGHFDGKSGTFSRSFVVGSLGDCCAASAGLAKGLSFHTWADSRADVRQGRPWQPLSSAFVRHCLSSGD